MPVVLEHASRRVSTAVLAALALALASALAGCGRTRVVGEGRTVGVVLTEYAIRPASIRAAPGVLTLLVRNYGARTHDLVVSLDGRSVGSTRALYPGQKQRITLALIPGTYSMASTILNDQALGAYGTLVVR